MYFDIIQKNNAEIKKATKSGLVIRSLEESSYYYWLRNSKKLMDAFWEEYNNPTSIKADHIIYLDAPRSVLDERCNNDTGRYMPETKDWYETKYHLYQEYWKAYPGVLFLHTERKKTEEIYQDVMDIIGR